MPRRTEVPKFVVLLLLSAVMVVLQPGRASACSCVPTNTADVVGRSELVFVGEEIGRVEASQTWPPIAVTFQVAAAYKGEVPRQVTVWTGQSDGDCGVGPLAGLVGIAAHEESGRWSINICGSVHDPAAIAAVLDPIEIAGSPGPAEDPSDEAGLGPWLPFAALGGILSAAGVGWVRRRRRDWNDGWSSSG